MDIVSFEPAIVRAALYMRVSTEDQAREGFSLRAQNDRLLSYCQARAWRIAGQYTDDGYTGRDTRRPEYQRMMAEHDRWDVALVLKMDRIHRNARNFMEMMDDLRKWGKDFASTTESFDTSTATGRFVVDILQRIAQLESEQTGERVKMGMHQAAIEGKFLGMSDPYGFRYDPESRNLVAVPEEAQVVREIYRLYFDKRWSMQAIADDLNVRGVATKRGRSWSKRQIHRVVHCSLYIGSRHWEDIVTPNTHEAIVQGGEQPHRLRRVPSRRARPRHPRVEVSTSGSP